MVWFKKIGGLKFNPQIQCDTFCLGGYPLASGLQAGIELLMTLILASKWQKNLWIENTGRFCNQQLPARAQSVQFEPRQHALVNDMWGFLPFQLSHHLIHGPTFRSFSEASLGSRWRKISGSCSKDGNSHGTFFTFLPNGDLSSHFSDGWWYTYSSEKYDFVSWDDVEIPNIWKVIKFLFQTTNQSVILGRMEFQSLAPGNAHVLATFCSRGWDMGQVVLYPKMPWL